MGPDLIFYASKTWLLQGGNSERWVNLLLWLILVGRPQLLDFCFNRRRLQIIGCIPNFYDFLKVSESFVACCFMQALCLKTSMPNCPTWGQKIICIFIHCKKKIVKSNNNWLTIWLKALTPILTNESNVFSALLMFKMAPRTCNLNQFIYIYIGSVTIKIVSRHFCEFWMSTSSSSKKIFRFRHVYRLSAPE